MRTGIELDMHCQGSSLMLIVTAAVLVAAASGCRKEEEKRPPEAPAEAETPYLMSDSGLSELKEYEAFVESAYDDGAGNMTIGYGHMIKPGETFPDTIAEAEGVELFRSDVRKIVDPSLKKVKHPLTQNQVDALGSFIFNTGAGSFERSVLPHLNAGNFEQATAEMAQYTRGRNQRTGEKVTLRGLEKRRDKEIALFNSPERRGAMLVGRSRLAVATRMRSVGGYYV